MHFKIRIELLDDGDIVKHHLDGISLAQILQSFDQIDWEQQKVLAFLEENDVLFPSFHVEDTQTDRTFGGLFEVYSRHEFNFLAHAELYQKQQKSYLLGLLKFKVMPSFDHDNFPFDVFRKCLELFVKGQDAEIERLFQMEYPSYSNTGIFDR